MKPHNFVKENGKNFSIFLYDRRRSMYGYKRYEHNCFIQKLSRFEVYYRKWSAVISKWSAEKNFVYGLSYEASPMFVTLPISNPPIIIIIIVIIIIIFFRGYLLLVSHDTS